MEKKEKENFELRDYAATLKLEAIESNENHVRMNAELLCLSQKCVSSLF